MTPNVNNAGVARGSATASAALFAEYQPLDGTFDEIFRPSGEPRHGVTAVVRRLDELGRSGIKDHQQLADAAFIRGGVTFSVYSDQRGVEKIFPFDLIPRVISAQDWQKAEAGLKQRVTALNMFLDDIYGAQRILDDHVIPRELIEPGRGFIPEVVGIQPRGGVYVHIAGVDLIRDPDGEFVVLEDNLRSPSGVSYVLENRSVMKRLFPQIFARTRIRSVDDYPRQLQRALCDLAPCEPEEAHLAVLTPGAFNSAYFEHSFLARRMGCDLVQGSDLFVDNDRVYLKTTAGPQQVDVIYRRIDDDFLDPEVFNPDSMLGVPGLMRAYAAGNVTLANAVGNGVADDKCIYAFVPDMIRYYLSEEPLIKQVRTYLCARDEDRQYVLDNMNKLVVKAVDGAGGYGMLMGPQASKKEIKEFEQKIKSDPRAFIAQPRVEFSTCPAWTRKGAAPRRVDLRPYIITGGESWVLPGGLTRVALKAGSYVVNSSQGGGSKDTWVLAMGSGS